ncbi:hypothetical protein DBR40_25625 [Pedobacter sp. KBW01]|nr:hypothetical protein DBR40_25625 [Pedobacter sp. KBW01]
MAMRAGCAIAFKSVASWFCSSVNISVLVSPIILHRNITIVNNLIQTTHRYFAINSIKHLIINDIICAFYILHGKKNYQKKLFISFQLSNYIPVDNFYKRLNETLDLEFIYRATAKYYGREGQKSIDPVVFMKLKLVGYLENLSSDRKIISTSRMRMDIMFFLSYDLDEKRLFFTG